MHTLSSAKRTCMASASAVECTATVGMPSSLQARSTRMAISPRLAIRILSNIGSDSCPGRGAARLAVHRRSGTFSHSVFATVPDLQRTTSCCAASGTNSFDDYQRFAELDRLAVLEQDLDHRARARRRNLVHGLHRFDDHQ